MFRALVTVSILSMLLTALSLELLTAPVHHAKDFDLGFCKVGKTVCVSMETTIKFAVNSYM